MKSLDEFIDDTNSYDDRIQKLEKCRCINLIICVGIKRKELEIDSRVNLPPSDLQKSDKELFSKMQIEEEIVNNRLICEIFNKKFKEDVTSSEIHEFTKQICATLEGFNYNYPLFLKQILKAIHGHKNTFQIDKEV